MHYEYEGKDVYPSVTVIGIVAGARNGNVLQYSAEEFNRYEEDYNALLKETVAGSEVLQNAEWTTVPEILSNAMMAYSPSESSTGNFASPDVLFCLKVWIHS